MVDFEKIDELREKEAGWRAAFKRWARSQDVVYWMAGAIMAAALFVIVGVLYVAG